MLTKVHKAKLEDGRQFPTIRAFVDGRRYLAVFLNVEPETEKP
jgi:hypothetical protein